MTLQVSSQRAAMPGATTDESEPHERVVQVAPAGIPKTLEGRIGYGRALVLSAEGWADVLSISIGAKDWVRAAQACQQLQAALTAAEQSLASTQS